MLIGGIIGVVVLFFGVINWRILILFLYALASCGVELPGRRLRIRDRAAGGFSGARWLGFTIRVLILRFLRWVIRIRLCT